MMPPLALQALLLAVSALFASPPRSVVVAGSRVGFTRDFTTGRVCVHFMESFHPDHVELLKKQERLGTVFFSNPKRPPTAEDLKLLAEVPMTGLALFDTPVSDENLRALRGHKHLVS